jgi:hypothetical protein
MKIDDENLIILKIRRNRIEREGSDSRVVCNKEMQEWDVLRRAAAESGLSMNELIPQRILGMVPSLFNDYA